MKALYLVLPCYNEEKSLVALVARTLACAKKRSLTPKDFTLCLVENGSKDESLRVLNELKNSTDGAWLKIVPVTKNQGYGYGLWQGLQSAPENTILAWSHADEQCDPEDVFRSWEKIGERDTNILVKGARNSRRWQDWIISRFFEAIASLIFQRPFHEINAQPKVFPQKLMVEIKNPPFDFAFDIYVLVKAKLAGYAFEEIPVEFPARKHGNSNWSATFRSKYRTITKIILFMLRLRLGETKAHAK